MLTSGAPNEPPCSTPTPTREICLHADPDALVDPICYNYTLTPTASYTPTPTPTGWTCTSSVETDIDTCQGSTWTPTSTPNPTVTPVPPTLSDFGIEFEGTWSELEREEVLVAAIETGRALSSLGISANGVDAFRIVLQGTSGGYWRRIKFSRVSFARVVCSTAKLPDSPDFSGNIQCDPALTMNRYTATHELGHVLVGRTIDTFTYIDSNGNTQLRSDSLFLDSVGYGLAGIGAPIPLLANSRFVMGFRSLNIYQSTPMPDWERSDNATDNGWGSAAQFNPQSPSAIYATFRAPDLPTATPTGQYYQSYHLIPLIGPCGEHLPATLSPLQGTALPFQQNPCTFPEAVMGTVESAVEEIEEAAADMFLNWVFWKNYAPAPLMPTPVGTPTPYGFQDVRWRYSDRGSNPTNCWFHGCPDYDNSGRARGDWMTQTLTNVATHFDWR